MNIQSSVPQLPDHLKTMAREQFLETIKQEERISHDDLYWILYRSATETNSVSDFTNRVESYLDAALGQDNYIVTLTTVKSGGSGEYDIHGKNQANVIFWAGGAGVLPGSVSGYAVICTVYTI